MKYEIKANERYGSQEIYFDEKPAKNVLDNLKKLKMRWNPKKSCWYGFAKESELIAAIQTADGNAVVLTDGYMGGGAIYGPKSSLHLYGSDLSSAIRNELKQEGIKQCFVRSKTYSGGQSLCITIKLNGSEYLNEKQFIQNYKIDAREGWIYTEQHKTGLWHSKYWEMNAEEREKTRISAAKFEYQRIKRGEQINQYHIDKLSGYTDVTIKKIQKINDIVNSYHYDNSNAMVDYFDTNFYYTIETKPMEK